MDFNVVTPEPESWDAFVERQGGHLLQNSRWGRFKSEFGWRDQLIALKTSDQIVAGAQVLYRNLPFGLGTIAYVPRGPIVHWHDADQVAALFASLDEMARRERAILLKVEANVEDSPAFRRKLTEMSFRESRHTVQSPRTILIDITGSDDEILARMNQGTRRKIRTASKREVSVRRGAPADVDSFNALAALTGQRDGFGVHSPDYYHRVFKAFQPDYAALFIASYAGTDLGALMAFRLGEYAWYLYGASSNEERDRMPNHALQWETMRWARENGCKTYDMWGIPDEEEAVLEAQFETRHDGLWGVYGFKRGFGGRVWRSVGAWDRVYNPLLYQVYQIAVRPQE